MEWESGSPHHSHTYPCERWRSPGRCTSWELEFRDCEAIPGWGLLLTVERQTEGMWGRKLVGNACGGKLGAMEARRYCWVTHRGSSHHRSLSPHASIGSWIIDGSIKHLMHWTTEQDPTQGAPLRAWCSHLQSRTPARGVLLCAWHAEQQRRTQAIEPSKCLNGQSYREWLDKEAVLSPATRGLKKDSDSTINPVGEAVCVLAHLVLPGSWQAR